ncbi:MAG: flagellar filament capping protein FliD [Sphingomonas sp.]|nr:flagellar filament capping protein FliD [Sphingomonas sp.]
MTTSIVNTLGAGSGIDVTSLVDQLVTASFQAKNQQLNSKAKQLSAEISSASTLKSDISNFADGLKNFATGGLVSSSVTSSDSTLVAASAIAGTKPTGSSTQVEIRQLAQAQVAAVGPVANRTATIGTGTLTLQFGTASTSGGAITGFSPGSGAAVPITIDSAHASLDGVASAINAANAGVTASIITDSAGARLVLKGSTGEAKAFTLTATEDAGAPGLAALEVGVGSTVGIAAQDAVVAVDGIDVKRATNSISDLITGVKLDLVAAKPGTIVTVGTSTPISALKQGVNDYVTAFNTLLANVKRQTNATDGPLRGDAAARTFAQSLGRLNLTTLNKVTTPGAPRTLAEIGVSTNRDGSLTVRADTLDAALKNYPAAVEALFADGTAASGDGLSAAFKALADTATSTTIGLGASIDRYTKAQNSIADQKGRVSTQTDTLRTNLTKQFTNSDAKVAAYKQTASFLTQYFAPKTSN